MRAEGPATEIVSIHYMITLTDACGCSASVLVSLTATCDARKDAKRGLLGTPTAGGYWWVIILALRHSFALLNAMPYPCVNRQQGPEVPEVHCVLMLQVGRGLLQCL